LSSIKSYFDKFVRWIRSLSTNRSLRLGVQLLVLAFCGIYLFSNFSKIKNVLGNHPIRPDLVGLSLALTIGGLFFGTIGWWLTLVAAGSRLDIWDATRAHLYSNLAKYLPGYGWQLFGKAYLTHQLGVETGRVGISMGLELFLLMATGILTGAVSFPTSMAPGWLPGWGQSHLLSLRLIIGILALAGPAAAGWVLTGLKKRQPGAKISIRWIYLAFLSMLLGWWVNGLAFWILGNSLSGFSAASVPAFIFTLAVSFLIGFLVFIIPGSFGVREGVIVLLLTPLTGQPLALTLAIVIRLIHILTDLSGVVIIRLAAALQVFIRSRLIN
jgi:hypothetical protein